MANCTNEERILLDTIAGGGNVEEAVTLAAISRVPKALLDRMRSTAATAKVAVGERESCWEEIQRLVPGNRTKAFTEFYVSLFGPEQR